MPPPEVQETGADKQTDRILFVSLSKSEVPSKGCLGVLQHHTSLGHAVVLYSRGQQIVHMHTRSAFPAPDQGRVWSVCSLDVVMQSTQNTARTGPRSKIRTQSSLCVRAQVLEAVMRYSDSTEEESADPAMHAVEVLNWPHAIEESGTLPCPSPACFEHPAGRGDNVQRTECTVSFG